MALLSPNYAITFHHGNQQMDFIRFEITPCMLKCNHFKPQNNFWSFSIVNWLVATSSIKRAAPTNTKKNNEFSITCLTMRHTCTYEQIPMFNSVLDLRFLARFFFSSHGVHEVATVDTNDIAKKARLHFCSISLVFHFLTA